MTLSRRTLLAALAAPRRAAKPLRFGICNETFGDSSFAEACRSAKAAGFTGIEIAPNTLKDPPAALRKIMRDEGLTFIGLHSLLSAPAGLHITTADAAVRKRGWDHLAHLVDVCSSLGSSGVMVLGSGKQRSAWSGGSSIAEASKRLEDGLAALAPIAHARGVTVLLEPLAPSNSDVVNTIGDAVAIVERVANPGLSTMIDTHNTTAEKAPCAELIAKYFRYIRHVHVNEMDGRHPGTGSFDFAAVLHTLERLGYQRWVSVEVFDFSAGGDVIAKESMRALRAAAGQ
jgi:D-psicose/D-tagatose/L-ribulose 3-epimerase